MALIRITQLAQTGALDGQAPTWSDDTSRWVPGYPTTSWAFSKGGVLTALTGTFRYYNPSERTVRVKQVRASVGTAPTGAAILIDVNRDGTSIFAAPGDRASIAIGANTGIGTLPDLITSPVELTTVQYLTVDIDQVGSTIAGSDLTVQITVA